VVFWTHTVENRATGWLGEKFYAYFRETLLHACGRYGLVCPIYVLMPDHWHLVWMGFTADSDQHSATKFLRKNLAPHVTPAKLQDRAHDSVLREEKRKRGAFAAACEYVRENPVRAGLVARWPDWPYSGAMVCGYPEFDVTDKDFWDDFWKIYNRLVTANESPGSPEPGYESDFPT
jgi:REP element-mobilizing transposase RayT